MLINHTLNTESFTLDQLKNLPIPQALGRRHVIRPFSEDAELMQDCLLDMGASIRDQRYLVRFDDQQMPRQMFGLAEIDLPQHNDPDYRLQVGLRGSYDQTLPRGIALGSHVMVCSNLAFHGDSVIQTKQTTYVNQRLPALMRSAVEQIPEMAESQSSFFDRLKNTPLSLAAGDHMLVEMLRRGAISASQLGKALTEWSQPSYPEHISGGRTAWLLHNAVTEALKGNSLPMIWKKTRILTEYLEA